MWLTYLVKNCRLHKIEQHGVSKIVSIFHNCDNNNTYIPRIFSFNSNIFEYLHNGKDHHLL